MLLIGITPVTILLIEGRARWWMLAAHFAQVITLLSIESAAPGWVTDGYTSDQQRMADNLACVIQIDLLIIYVMAMLTRQYLFRVKELEQERQKVKMLLEPLLHDSRTSPNHGTDDTVDALLDHPIQSQTIVGSYRLLRQLGSGGMAVVYLAQHNTLGTEHAIKMIRTRERDKQLRLIREGEVQSRIHSPYIAAVTDTIVIGNRVGLVMDYQNGGTLKQRLDVGRLSFPEVDKIARQLIEGLSDAHEHGLVHRDLKPENILFNKSEGGEIARISDFGIVKLEDSRTEDSLTRTGVLLGTPAYMSPEQIKDPTTVDARADLWSLGCIFYEMLAGKPAFAANTTLGILHLIHTCDFPPLAEDVPARMRKAIELCLVVDKGARIRSAMNLFAVWTGALTEVAPADATPS